METNMEGFVEELTAEIARLEGQRRAAEAEADRATERLKELSTRRAALAPGVSPGEKVAGELAALVAALDLESAAHSRTRAIAQDAARELDRLILETEVRHWKKEKHLARGRYEMLCKERYSLDREAEKAMAGLVNVLDRLEELYSEQVRVAADAEDFSPAQQDPRATIEQWLLRRLHHWLPHGSLEKYDTLLSELDPLALRPESDEEAS
jgi:chromosome segregation ATPase